MYKNHRIGVVIPAHNEELFIGEVIDTLPDFIDKIIVTDDGSTDRTSNILAEITNQKLIVITHERNRGSGAAIISGYKKACEIDVDVIATMDGDGQMDPAILNNILDPVVEERADYAKGNRLSTSEDRQAMPKFRCFGNYILTFLTRVASGYWGINDPQCGYTAISSLMLQKLDLHRLHEGWPFLNDMLIKLHVLGARVTCIPIRAQYGKERSHIKYPNFIANTSWLLLSGYLWRIRSEHLK